MKTYDIKVSDLADAVKAAEWGTRGPNGDQPIKYVRLVDCSSDHLRAIRQQTSKMFGHSYTEIIDFILNSRS